MGIEAALYALLTGESPSIAGGRIYPVVLPEQTAYPAVTYERVSGERGYVLRGATGTARPRFRIHVWSTSYDQTLSIADEIRLLINDYQGVVGSVDIMDVKLESENDLYEDDTGLHHKVLDYFIQHRETV